MSDNQRRTSGPRVLRPVLGFGTRAASSALRPLAGVVEAAAGAGANLQRRAVDRVLDSDEIERVLVVAVNSAHIEAALRSALSSEGAARLVDALFDSRMLDRLVDAMFETGVLDRLMAELVDRGVLDRFFERLLASEGFWHMIDEVAASPAVTAAISQQGLGFADQVGEEVRTRSRKADDWVERAARRLTRRPPRVLPAEPDSSS